MVLNRLKGLHLHRSDKQDRKAAQLLINDMQQIQNYVDNELIQNHYQFSSIMFIENIPDETIYEQIVKNNSLLLNHHHKYYSNEEHATTNLSVPYVFCADITHASVPLLSGIRAALQVQFECDFNKGILPPSKPRSEIMPMCHDINDPMFKHLMVMVEDAFAWTLKSPKVVTNFAANNYYSEWYIYDSKGGNENFAKQLKLSYDYLMKNNKLTGTFTEWMYGYWNLRTHNVKDVRIIFIGGDLATGPYTDTGHLRSSNNSVTLHLNAWNSWDYIPGNTSSGPWTKPSYKINSWNTNGFISGKFGELDCWFCKAKFKFIFGTELEYAKRNLGLDYFAEEPCAVLLNKIKRNCGIGIDEHLPLKIKANDYKPIVRGKGKKIGKE